MHLYEVEVEETIHRTVRYRVLADDWGSAQIAAEDGITEKETVLQEHGVMGRTVTPNTVKHLPLFIRVEYDLNYYGGDYSGVGKFALLPEGKLDPSDSLPGCALKRLFKQETGHDPQHIIHYSFDEVYDCDGDLIEDYDEGEE